MGCCWGERRRAAAAAAAAGTPPQYINNLPFSMWVSIISFPSNYITHVFTIYKTGDLLLLTTE